MISKWVVRLSVAALVEVVVYMPIAASAQQASGIAGVVRDTSRAVLPGVTVEAASPALIEKVRTVVTFTLTGFNTFRREGIRLTAGFTATVNADLQVGALEETVTVTGAAPMVIARLVPGVSNSTDRGGGGAAGIKGANRTTNATLHGIGGEDSCRPGCFRSVASWISEKNSSGGADGPRPFSLGRPLQ